ncbi:MAG TPA: hypothetical protein VMF52_00015 [Steroidobacteraceae bacterium]|nr:hypothetical protein [Steroidobacteraceae bacterium]
MYLDPGSTGLFVQALFALFATVLTMFARSRAWIAGLWARVTQAIKPRRPPDA